MSRKQEARDINRMRGLPQDSPINISTYCRYNSSTTKSSHKMGQNGSQAIGVAIENQTNQKKIISFNMENKLCWVGSWVSVQCPCHPDFTVTINDEEPLSEKRIKRQLGMIWPTMVYLSNQYVVTTDGDGRSASGVQTTMRRTYPDSTVERQADTTHLGQSLFRYIIRATFSKDMFPGQSAFEICREHTTASWMALRTRAVNSPPVLLVICITWKTSSVLLL